MSEKTAATRLEEALAADEPFPTVHELAKRLKSEGMSQRDMYQLFDEFRSEHEDDKVEPKYDAILDTMDFIVGWCNPSLRLFEKDLRNDADYL